MSDNIDSQKLSLERERLQFERQKLAIELRLLRREKPGHKGLSFKEFLANPAALAIVGGFITVMSTILTAAYTATLNERTEALRAQIAREGARETLQADLIKKFVDGPKLAVRENLKFLAEAGFLPSYKEAIAAYLKSNPDSAPSIPFSSGIVGNDDAVAVDSLPATNALVAAANNVGRLESKDAKSRGAKSKCTAFLTASNFVVSTGFCYPDKRDEANFVLTSGSVELSSIANHQSGDAGGDYAVFRLEGSLPNSPSGLALSAVPPKPGDQLAVIMFRGDAKQLAEYSKTCVVTDVGAATFGHGCDTGPGSSGSPVILLRTGEVVGIHVGRNNAGGFATRIDILPNPEELSQQP